MGNSYKQLTLAERYQIQTLGTLVFSARRMGDYLNRSNKTISLELMRCHRGAYDAEEAHRHSLQKRKTATKFHKRTDAVSRQVKSQLGLGFTLEQIAGRMKLESYNGAMGYQTIYRLIKKNQWSCLLPRKGKRYRKRHGSKAGARLIPNRVDIVRGY